MNQIGSLNFLEKLRFLLKDSVIYGGLQSFAKLFSLLTFPIVARYFTKADFGLIDSYVVLSLLIMTLNIQGQDSAVARLFYESEENSYRKQVISVSLFYQLALSILLCAVLFLLGHHLSNFYTGEHNHHYLVYYVVANAPFAMLFNFSSNLLKWTFARWQFVAVVLTQIISNVVFLLLFLFHFKLGLLSVILATLLANTLSGVLGTFLCRNWLSPPKQFSLLKPLLKFGLPYGIIGVIALLTPAADRYFIAKYLNLSLLGVYSVSHKIANFINIPVQAFQTAWGPFFLSIHKDDSANYTYSQILVFFSILVCFMALLLNSITYPVTLLASSAKYMDSISLIPVLLIGLLAQSISWVSGIGIDLSKKSYLVLYCYSLGLLSSVCWLYFTIQDWGLLWGASTGFSLGLLLKAILYTYLGQRAYRIPFEFTRPTMAFLYTCVVLMASAMFQDPLHHMVFASVLTTSFIPLAWVMILKPEERETLAELAKSLMTRK